MVGPLKLTPLKRIFINLIYDPENGWLNKGEWTVFIY